MPNHMLPSRSTNFALSIYKGTQFIRFRIASRHILYSIGQPLFSGNPHDHVSIGQDPNAAPLFRSMI